MKISYSSYFLELVYHFITPLLFVTPLSLYYSIPYFAVFYISLYFQYLHLLKKGLSSFTSDDEILLACK